MYDKVDNTVAEICKIFNISRACFYKYLNKREKNEAV